MIYDTIGSAESFEVGVRVAQPRATIVVTGVDQPAALRWTPLYFKEIALVGSNAFGIENFEGDSPCTDEQISVTYADLPEQAAPGKHILIADGLMDLEIVAVEGRLTRCVVRTGGQLGSRKNVNILGIKSRLPSITGKDRVNIDFAVKQDMDFVAASFVRKPDDVLEIRKILLAKDPRFRSSPRSRTRRGWTTWMRSCAWPTAS